MTTRDTQIEAEILAILSGAEGEVFSSHPLLASSRWIIRGLTGQVYNFDFDDLKVSAHLVSVAKEFLLSLCKEDEDRTLLCSEWSLFRVKRIIKILNAHMAREKLTRISQLSSETLERMLSNMIKGHYDEGNVIAFSTYQLTYNSLLKLRDLYLLRKINDGPQVTPSRDRCLVIAVQALESLEEDYPSWVAGSHWGGMPMSLLILLLSDAIAVLQSPETKYVLAFFEYQKDLLRAQQAPAPLNASHNRYPRTYTTDSIQRYFLSEESKRFRKKANSLACVLPYYCVKACGVDSVDDLPLKHWPFKRTSNILRHVQCVYEAGYIVFSCVTGARRNEIEGLLVSDLIKRKDGGFNFRSLIHKTNHGIPTIRSVSGLAAQVVDLLERLCLADKRGLNMPLFCAPRGLSLRDAPQAFRLSTMTNLANEQNARHILRRYIEKRFLAQHPALSAELKKINVTPHRFRHAFAEFALRRFDGNVPELIRRHFRHHYQSFMTSMYTFDKIHVSESYTWEQIGLNYLAELGLNWLGDKEQLYGPIGIALKNKVKSLRLLPADELHEELTQWIGDEFTGHLKAMEYGFCVLRLKTLKKANCRDKVTGVPTLQEASMTMCSGCPHLLSTGSQRPDIIRIGQSILEQQKTYTQLGIAPLINACRKEVKRAQAMLKMVGAGGDHAGI